MTVALNQCLQGDALEVLPGLVAAGLKVNCVVTSPPYWGLRDYGMAGQIGLEATPGEYVLSLARLFALVREMLAEDGTLWLNLGDTWASGFRASNTADSKYPVRAKSPARCRTDLVPDRPDKNLLGLPWRVAFALQDEGWILRSAVVWHKPNPMSESIKDRPTRSYEHIFLFSRNGKYFYDAEAAREPAVSRNIHDYASQGGYQAPGQPAQSGNRPLPKNWSFARSGGKQPVRPGGYPPNHRPDHPGWGRKNRTVRPGIDTKGGGQGNGCIEYPLYDRNWRDVWTITPQPCAEAHFATMPEELVKRCLIAGTRPGDLVLDPFMGSGTVAVVAEKMDCRWLGIELNPEYLLIQNKRLAKLQPLLKAAGV